MKVLERQSFQCFHLVLFILLSDFAMEEEEDFEIIIIHETQDQELEEADMNLMHFAQLKGMFCTQMMCMYIPSSMGYGVMIISCC